MDSRINIKLNRETSDALRKIKAALSARLGISVGQTQAEFANQLLLDYSKFISSMLEDPKVNYLEIQKRLNSVVNQSDNFKYLEKLQKANLDRLDMLFYLTIGLNTQQMKLDGSWKEVDSLLEAGSLANQAYVTMGDRVTMDKKLKNVPKNGRLL